MFSPKCKLLLLLPGNGVIVVHVVPLFLQKHFGVCLVVAIKSMNLGAFLGAGGSSVDEAPPSSSAIAASSTVLPPLPQQRLQAATRSQRQHSQQLPVDGEVADDGDTQVAVNITANILSELTVKDIESIAALRQRMVSIRRRREEMKNMIEASQYLVTYHHAEHALGNISLFRTCENTRAQIQQTKDEIARLEEDGEVARKEHVRVSDINQSLLQGIQEKDRERQRVLFRIEAHQQGERKTVALRKGIEVQDKRVSSKRNRLNHKSTGVVSRVGRHHGEVMIAEQDLIDLSLEVDLLVRELRLLRGEEETQEDMVARRTQHDVNRVRDAWRFRACDNAQCVRLRENLRTVREQLAGVEATLRFQNQQQRRRSSSNMQ